MDHFDGKKFFNPWNRKPKSSLKFLFKAGPEIRKRKWPTWIDLPKFPAPPQRNSKTELHITVINHDTVFIQVDGLNILTDPVYSQRTSPVQFVGPKRIHRPAIAFNDLPPIDLVLLSHNHYDHMDVTALKKLDKDHQALTIAPLKNGEFLQSKGLQKTLDLDWWQSTTFQTLKVTCVPAQHWSSRSIADRNDMLWGGFVLERANGEKIYFAGDTGYAPFFKDIYERMGPMDLSLLPIGAYEPRWFMKDMHMNPEDAVLAHMDLHSKQSIGVHFGCFKLTSEAVDDPVKHLEAAKMKHKIKSETFFAPEFGRVYLNGKST
jgi:L-ascorbate metabolism protein UlaG (beta-lactamase superfamily)